VGCPRNATRLPQLLTYHRARRGLSGWRPRQRVRGGLRTTPGALYCVRQLTHVMHTEYRRNFKSVENGVEHGAQLRVCRSKAGRQPDASRTADRRWTPACAPGRAFRLDCRPRRVVERKVRVGPSIGC